MPSAVSRPAIPFVGERFDPRTRLGDYARRSGRDTADAMRQQGALSAQMWQGIGQNVSGTLRDIAAYPDQQRARQRQETLIQREEQAYQDAQQAKQADGAKAQRLQELVKEHGGRVPSERLLQEFGPEDAADISKAFDEVFPVPKAPEPFTLNPGDTRFDGTGKPIANVPKPEPVEKPRTYQVTVPGPDGRPMSRLATEEEMAKGVPTYQAPKEPKAPPAPRSPIWVIGPDGEFKDLAGVAPPGSKPSNSREQGRAVTSGDAGRIAELDTSLDDLGVLGSALESAGSTGATAKVGAMVPNFVTEYTGWGSDAKKKQALIDRVKQVIGKALEGGVLRKEDELKYEKILPTVGDPNELVISKLAGLGDAIKLRRTRTIESLADAGYDTSKFGEYESPLNKGVTAVPDLSGIRPGMGRKFTDGPFKGQTWSLGPDGKPFKVGG